MSRAFGCSDFLQYSIVGDQTRTRDEQKKVSFRNDVTSNNIPHARQSLFFLFRLIEMLIKCLNLHFADVKSRLWE